MRPILTLCELSPLESRCQNCWTTPPGLPAPLLLLSFVEEREYLGRDSSRWAHLLVAIPPEDVKLDWAKGHSFIRLFMICYALIGAQGLRC